MGRVKQSGSPRPWSSYVQLVMILGTKHSREIQGGTNPRTLRPRGIPVSTSWRPHLWVRRAFTSTWQWGKGGSGSKSNMPQAVLLSPDLTPRQHFLNIILLSGAQCTNTPFDYIHMKKEIGSTVVKMLHTLVTVRKYYNCIRYYKYLFIRVRGRGAWAVQLVK